MDTGPPEAASYDFAAFISYRHVNPDRAWAIWLQTALETYRPPRKLIRDRTLPQRKRRIFRDEEELSATSDLSQEIDLALRRSEFLIVVCSPRTPESRWVNEEVTRFRKMGRHDRVLALLIEGEPRDAFPPSLCEILGGLLLGDTGSESDREPLAADVRPSARESQRFRKRMAKLRLLAPILGCRFDDLRQRDQERLTRRLAYVGLILAGLLIVISGLATVAFVERNEAVRQRAAAVKNFQMAQDSVDQYFTQVSEDRRLAAHGLEPLRRDLLSSAAQFYDRFVAQEAHKGSLTYENAWAKFRLASINDEISTPAETVARFEEAAQTFRDLAKTGNASPAPREGVLMCQINLSRLYERVGQRERGKKALTEALGLARSLVAEFPQMPSARHLLARCLDAQGRFASEEGNLAAAAAAFHDEIRSREQIVLSDAKRPEFEKELATAYRNLAVVEQRYEHLDEARKLLDKSLAVERRMVRENPDDGFLQHMLARTLTHRGDLAMRAGRGDEARNAYREAVELRILLVKRHPDVLEYRLELAITADNFGVFCMERGDYDAAQTYYQDALSQAERLATDYPDQTEYQTTFASALTNAAQLCSLRDRLSLAEQLLNRAYQIRSKQHHDLPNDVQRQEELASVYLALAIVETNTKHTEQAEKHLRSAMETYQRLSDGHVDRPFYRERLGLCFKQLGDLFKSERRDDEAVAAYKRAQELERKLVGDHSAVLQHRLDLAGTCVNLGNLQLRRRQPDLAVGAFDEIIRLFADASRSTLDRAAQPLVEKAYTGRALAREIRRDLAGMGADFQQAISLAAPGRARVLRLMCANSLAQGGQIDRAVAVAEPLLSDRELDGSSAFELASLYVRAADAASLDKASSEKDRGPLVERRIQQGLELLKRALHGGYFAEPSNRKKLEGPPFTRLLSANPAYHSFVEAVQKGPSTKGAPREK